MVGALSRPGEPGAGPAEAVAVLAALVGLELLAAGVFARPPTRAAGLWTVGGLRAAEVLLLGGYARFRGWGPAGFGLAAAGVRRGATVGILCCAALGAGVMAAEGAFRLFSGGSFLALVRGPLPGAGEWLPLVAVGAGIAPLFEELVFRGLLYAALRRRLPVLAATAAVTALFAAAHLPTAGVPWVQAVGGLVFCAAYELSGGLWAPLLVHAAGNLALFLLPLWV